MTDPVKVCIVGFDAWTLFKPAEAGHIGGSEVQLYTLARELAKDPGYSVNFVVRDESSGPETIDGVIVHKLRHTRKAGRHKRLSYIAELWRLMRTVCPDVVVQRAAGSQTALLSLYCVLNRKRFVYMTAADSDVEPAMPACFQGSAAWRAYRIGLRMADRVIVQHDRQWQRLMDNYGKAGIVRPCALAAEGAVPTGERRTILWVGRCERIKQPEEFITLARAFPHEPFVMVCTPAASGAAFFESVRSQALKLDNMTFVKHVPFHEIGRYFRDASLFVNTSIQEGFPNTFVQSWMHGTPVVSLAVDPGAVIVRRGLGITCDGSQEALVKAVAALLADPLQRERLSRDVFAYAREHHDIQRQIERDRLWLCRFRGQTDER